MSEITADSYKALLARLPLTADGVPIFLGDTVFAVDENLNYDETDIIAEIKVNALSSGVDFDRKGTVTVHGGDFECGNLDCDADKKTLRALLEQE